VLGYCNLSDAGVEEAMDRLADATTHLREAAAIYRRLGVPDAGRIATALPQA
jgi:hypothetical protein